MGWTFPHSTTTKARLKEEILSDYRHHPNWKILKTALVGSCFWMALHSLKTDEKFIVLYLMEKHDGVYGYKDMDETMHPFFYNCPLSLLDLTTSPKNEANPWRRAMRANAARVAMRKITPIKVGDFVTVRNGKGFYKVIGRCGTRSWHIEDVKTNRIYKCGTTRLFHASILDIPNPCV